MTKFRGERGQSCKLHARRRGRQRFGLSLKAPELARLVCEIQSGRARFIERHSQTRTKWAVTINGKPAVAVYSRTTKAIVTVWRAGSPEERGWIDGVPASA